MRSLGPVVLASALVALLGAIAGALAPSPAPPRLRLLEPSPPPSPPREIEGACGSPWQYLPSLPAPSRYAGLGALTIVNVNSGERASIRLYSPSGELDEQACEALDEALADARKPPKPYPKTTMDRRLLKLIYRTAYRFGASEVEVVSGYRRPIRFAEGLHAKGRAVDFRLDTARAKEVAEYLRSLPRVGVGLYTHPRTQFVHLDVRDTSYHWVDGTPPGKRWGEWRLKLPDGQSVRDSEYEEQDDLPEVPPPRDRPPPFR